MKPEEIEAVKKQDMGFYCRGTPKKIKMRDGREILMLPQTPLANGPLFSAFEEALGRCALADGAPNTAWLETEVIRQ
jgi:hypothetical protein